MVSSQRSEYVETLVRDLRLNPAIDKVPTDVAPNIQTTYELRPTIQAKNIAMTNSTSTTIIATGDRDCYLLGISASFVKDVTATTTLINAQATVEGVNTVLLSFNVTTTTIERGDANLSIPFPGLKIDRTTNMTMASTTNVGNFFVRCTIYYYVMSK